MRQFINKTLVVLTFSGLLISPLQAKNSQSKNNMQEIRDEVSIMLNIFQATLKQRKNDKSIQFRAESVTYLAHQGVVFNIDSGRHSGSFFGGDFGGMMNAIPIAPKPPVTPRSSQRSGGNRFEMNMGDREIEVVNFDPSEIEVMVQRFIKHGESYDDDMRDNIRDLNEEQRELVWKKRELERTRRDLDFQKRNADAESSTEISQELAEINKEEQVLVTKTKELEKHMQEMQADYQKEVAKRKAAKSKVYNQSLALFEETVGRLLCRYGAGLRTLPENENISFVLSDFMQAEDGSAFQTHDKVYVFKQKDVISCVIGKQDQEQLLSKANTYLF